MSETNVDPRVEELREIEARIKTILSIMKGKHTPESVQRMIDDAESYIGDHSTSFVTIDGGSTVVGSRHFKGLLQLSEALKLKVDMGNKDLQKEVTRLLERKIHLMKDIHNLK